MMLVGALQLQGSAQRVLQPLKIAFAANTKQPVAAAIVRGCRALAVFSLLVKRTGCGRTNFHPLYFLHVACDACKMKLVTLSGRSLTVTQGKWQSDPENTAVCVCVFCHFLTYTPTQRKTDVPLRCPRREQSHLLEELCCCCTMTLSLYRGIHLLPLFTIRPGCIKPITCVSWQSGSVISAVTLHK